MSLWNRQRAKMLAARVKDSSDRQRSYAPVVPNSRIPILGSTRRRNDGGLVQGTQHQFAGNVTSAVRREDVRRLHGDTENKTDAINPRASSTMDLPTSAKWTTTTDRPSTSQRSRDTRTRIDDHTILDNIDRPYPALRRKEPTINQYSTSSKTSEAGDMRRPSARPSQAEAGSSYDRAPPEKEDGTILGIAIPGPPLMTGGLPNYSSEQRSKTRSPVPELSTIGGQQFPSIPLSGTPVTLSTGTPSTFYSESVGPWSSRDTTPISMSSYSPVYVPPSASAPKLASPFRSRQPDPRLPIRNNSSHTVYIQEQPNDTSDAPISNAALPSRRSPSTPAKLTKRPKIEKSRTPHPTPPPRKSSTKFRSPSGKSVLQESSGSPKPRRPKGSAADVTMNVMDPESSRGLREGAVSTMPRRPSRQGTTDLEVEASPIIHSDLPPDVIKFYRKPESDGESQRYARHMAPTVSSANKTQPPVAQRSISRQPSPVIGPPIEPKVTPIHQPKAFTGPTSSTRRGSNESTKSEKPSKFGFFGLHKRSKARVDEEGKESKATRKGPAAGTGHEGYGKYAHRGRRPSMSGQPASRGRSASTADSTGRSVSSWKTSNPSGSESELDDFVSQRLEPIVIPGGGLSSHGNRYEGSDYNSSGRSLRRMPSGNLAERDTAIQDSPQHSDIAYALSRANDQSIIFTAEDKPTLAARRSLLHLRRHGGSEESLRLPSPIKATPYDPTLSVVTIDSTQSPIPRSDSSVPPTSTSSIVEGHQKTKDSRWNFFSRKRRNQRSSSRSPEKRSMTTHMQVAVADVPEIRPIPHYAMLDSDQDMPGPNNKMRALEELFDVARESSGEELSQFKHGIIPGTQGLRFQNRQSVLLPSPPGLSSQFPVAFLTASNMAETVPGVMTPGMKTRLNMPPERRADEGPSQYDQVRRVSPAAYRAGQQHQRPLQSFSRPFGIRKPEQQPVQPSSVREDRPLLGVRTDPLPSKLFNEPGSSHPLSAPAETGSKTRSSITQPEFLTYTSWYGSGSSGSSSSQTKPPVTRQSPRTTQPDRRMVEEDAWHEYDDLIDDVLSPAAGVLQQPDIEYFGPQKTELQATPDYLEPPPLLYDTGTTSPKLKSAVSTESVRLRRSRIHSALHSSLDASTPSSLAELVADYEQRNRNSTILLDRMSFLFEESEEPDEPDHPAEESKEPLAGPSNRQRATVLLDIAERYREGPVGLSNLRYGALMISRWLSFSRVLFSPVHNKIISNPNERVLVLDGLGNDDWSFYCAETYTTATVHSLNSMVQPSMLKESVTEAWPAPPNHRAAKVNTPVMTFPFPQSYFAAVVFRFPAAMSESALRRTIGECYRVLQPGGYIELTVMDLDMMNMGNRTRRAVRMLKVRMNVADAGISLKPASDNILKILGRRGYQNLNKCIVSVPVSGTVGSSSIDSSSSRHSQGSVQRDSATAAEKAVSFVEPMGRRSRAESSTASERNFLLSDLIADESPRSDHRITRMVARVGRWWYTRCYEWAVLPDGDLERSIWADKQVLQECENRGSGFKLLIAYAQKPIDTRRRTMSEPNKPVGAVAGGSSSTTTSRPGMHDSL